MSAIGRAGPPSITLRISTVASIPSEDSCSVGLDLVLGGGNRAAAFSGHVLFYVRDNDARAIPARELYGHRDRSLRILRSVLGAALRAVVALPLASQSAPVTASSPPRGDIGLVWALVVLLLYPACAWYAAVKRRRRDAWMSYL